MFQLQVVERLHYIKSHTFLKKIKPIVLNQTFETILNKTLELPLSHATGLLRVKVPNPLVQAQAISGNSSPGQWPHPVHPPWQRELVKLLCSDVSIFKFPLHVLELVEH